MLTTLFLLVRTLLRSPVLELLGAVLVVIGVVLVWGAGAGFIAGGVALLLKAMDADLSPPGDV